MPALRFDSVRKVFGEDVVALEEFSLEIPDPSLVVLVGPSGCGKTTLLRLIAGLERPTSGAIMLGERRLDTLDPRRRDVAMVFQNYALYPHMTVRENLSFGLKIRKVARDVIARGVAEVSKSLEIDHLLERRPAELSGGQRQRVALGRAVIREPKVFLFDEPLSNLDARLRDEMRYLIKRLYQKLRTTTVYVTHDQVEAMTIGEMLVVLRDGRIHQVGSPAECYRAPNDTFVASFLGSPPMNLLEGAYDRAGRSVRLRGQGTFRLSDRAASALDQAGEDELIVGIRPEDLATAAGAADNGVALSGELVLRETLGHDVLNHIDLGGREIVARGSGLQVEGGTGRVAVSAAADALHFFAKGSGRRIGGPAVRIGQGTE